MIRSKRDLKYYLAADKFALGKKISTPKLNDVVWKFQILLRKVEYYQNVKGGFLARVLLAIAKYKKHKLAINLGFDIPSNTFGPGLRINHFGNIVVNKGARIGWWCDIHQGVNIGSNNSMEGTSLVPHIGDNVWIGPGAKIFGDINIGNEVQIAANAVVNKNIANNQTVAGIPAKSIKPQGTESVDVAASRNRMLKFFQQHPEYNDYFQAKEKV